MQTVSAFAQHLPAFIFRVLQLTVVAQTLSKEGSEEASWTFYTDDLDANKTDSLNRDITSVLKTNGLLEG